MRKCIKGPSMSFKWKRELSRGFRNVRNYKNFMKRKRGYKKRRRLRQKDKMSSKHYKEQWKRRRKNVRLSRRS